MLLLAGTKLEAFAEVKLRVSRSRRVLLISRQTKLNIVQPSVCNSFSKWIGRRLDDVASLYFSLSRLGV
jgi:hypothetical protein